MSYGTTVRPGPQQIDKTRRGIQSALVERCLAGVASPALSPGQSADDLAERRQRAYNEVYPVSQRSPEAKDFRNAGLFDMAREFVQHVNGVDVNQFARDHIAVLALLGPVRGAETLGIDLRSDPAYHTTGSFANVTLDAMNKSMMLGYKEAPSTWEQCFRIGMDVDDFKGVNRVRVGGVPNIPVWADDGKPASLSIGDGRESYAVEARSGNINFSYRLIVNDDMDALSKIPGMFGQAFRRTVNKLAWSPIISNPMMSDNVALFSAASGLRKRKNTETGAISNYTLAINQMTANMMVMRGENTPEGNESDDVLALTPRHIAFPAALRGTILQLVSSEADPNATHSGAKNINANLNPICEPLLDLASTTAIYLFADSGQIDTIEVTFLRGQREPQLRQTINIETLCQQVFGLQTVGVKAMNHRGLQRHAGA